MSEIVRVNTRIPKHLNEWIDSQAESSGLSKSAVILTALQNYKREQDALDMMGVISEMMEKIEQLEAKTQRNGSE